MKDPEKPLQAHESDDEKRAEVSRRDFLGTSVVLTAGACVAPILFNRSALAAESAVSGGPSSSAVDVTLRVNGTAHALKLEPRVTLLDALREEMQLAGTKKGCDHGQCGACTVLVDGRRTLSCLTLAVMHDGDEITTIEGLAGSDELHPMQAAFIERDAFQCGYCTPGQIMSAVALLREPCGVSDDDVRECMSGNICRCGAYPNIVAAVQDVRRSKTT
jgi:xanthine dehydrogenase YagT iron-sulfur-binding subunit